DVADEIEIEVVVERRVARVESTDQEQRVTVGRGTHDCLGCDVAAGSRTVVDDERLTEPLRQPLTYQARRDVRTASRREANNDAHRPRWIGLRPSDARDCRQRSSAGGQMQKISAGKFHVEPPSRFTSLDHLIGAYQKRRRYFKAKRLGRFEVEDSFVFGRRLHREFGGLGAAQDSVDVGGCLSVLFKDLRPVGHEAAGRYPETERGNRRQAVPGGKRDDEIAMLDGGGIRQYDQATIW